MRGIWPLESYRLRRTKVNIKHTHAHTKHHIQSDNPKLNTFSVFSPGSLSVVVLLRS